MTTRSLLFKADVYAYWRERKASAMEALALAYGPPPMLPAVRDLYFWADLGDEEARAQLRPMHRREVARCLARAEAAR